MLKVASFEQSALEYFRGGKRKGFEVEPRSIDYGALVSSLTPPVSETAGAGYSAVDQASRLVPLGLREVPLELQVAYPEQGRVIGQQKPGSSKGWHNYLINFSDDAHAAFVQLSAEHGVLTSLAIGCVGDELRDRPVQQYTQGSSPDPYAVFTTGYSVFLEYISRENAREWFERVVPLNNGIGVLALRRAGAETRTDTLIIRIDLRDLPQLSAGRSEVLVVLGWDRPN